MTGGPSAGLRVALPRGEHTVGRDPEATIVLDDPSLSRTHVRLLVDGDVVSVRDAPSKNGTSVEGVLLGSQEVRQIGPEELVEAGRSVFTFRRGVPARGPGSVRHRRGPAGWPDPLQSAAAQRSALRTRADRTRCPSARANEGPSSSRGVARPGRGRPRGLLPAAQQGDDPLRGSRPADGDLHVRRGPTGRPQTVRR